MAWIADTGTRNSIRPTATIRGARLAVVVAALSVTGTAAATIRDTSGTIVPNTETTSLTAQIQGSPTIPTLLGTPFSAPQPPGTGSPDSPEQDLVESLSDLASAADQTAATTARDRALAILTGGSVPGAVYDGIGLLNDNPQAKTKTVPAGGNVVVRIVRFGEHEITDTARLTFQDENQPFTITYEVTEIGGAEGGDLTPTPLLVDGTTAIGGLHSAVFGLGLDETNLGSTQESRFTLARGLAPQPEHTRMATQRVTVRMPPPRYVSVVLNPNLRPGHESLTALRRSDAPAINPTLAQLAPAAPERQLHTALTGLDTADLPAAHSAGSQGLSLVNAMRVKSHLPNGVSPVAGTDVTVAFLNNELYVSRTSVRLAAGAPVRIGVINRDGVAHTVSPIALDSHKPNLGATNWGEFDWTQLPASAVAAGDSVTVTVTPPGDAFTLIVGDPTSGDQATAFVTLDRGPVQESFKVPGPAFAAPLHQVIDGAGRIWVTLPGVDRIGRLTPAPGNAPLASSTYVEYKLPPPCGTGLGTAAVGCGPFDIDVDANGIIWATIPQANSLIRLDPSVASPSSACTATSGSDCPGVRLIELLPCDEFTEICRVPPPPAPPGVPSREPTQMTVMMDEFGNTDIWFVELLADKIGRVKMAPNPPSDPDKPGLPYVQEVGQGHFGCQCKVLGTSPTNQPVLAGNPTGIEHDAQGRIWFSEANANRIGRLDPATAQSQWFQESAQVIRHYKIPSGIAVAEPDIGGTFVTSVPHSVEVDPSGKVWFTELGMHQVGYLDPAKAVPNTTSGMVEIDLGVNDFGSHTQPADLVSDADGNIFVTEEYGDHISKVRPNCVIDHWRPTERLSLTDQPAIDAQGNLWFLELSANLITRIKGVGSTTAVTPPSTVCGKPSDGGGGGGGGGGSTPPDGSPGSTPQPTTPPPPPPVDPLAVACANRNWVFGTETNRRVLLLGSTTKQVIACLGKPTSRTGTATNGKWTYTTQLVATIRSGRLTAYEIRGKKFRTTAGLGVGSTLTAVRRLTAKPTANAAKTQLTATLRTGDGKRVQIRYFIAKSKVSRIVVTLLGSGR